MGNVHDPLSSDPLIDGILWDGWAWSTNIISFIFPTTNAAYTTHTYGFTPFNQLQMDAARLAFNMIDSFTDRVFQEVTNFADADLHMAATVAEDATDAALGVMNTTTGAGEIRTIFNTATIQIAAVSHGLKNGALIYLASDVAFNDVEGGRIVKKGFYTVTDASDGNKLIVDVSSSFAAGTKFTGGDFQDNDCQVCLKPVPTANGAPPTDSNVAAHTAGDMWFELGKYDDARSGSYQFANGIIHEIGHALGLKHPHDANEGSAPLLPAAWDGLAYTIMSYRDFPGDATDDGAGGGPQSYMMLDIQALQYLYGADFFSTNGDDVYSFKPDLPAGTATNFYVNGAAYHPEVPLAGNWILRTIWDGNGYDTYDFTAYSADLLVDLQPGHWTTVDPAQLFVFEGTNVAPGNIANALLYHGDLRSLIEEADGGTGNDRMTGNVGANTLKGGDGNDTLTGGGGDDTLNGGAGSDTADYSDATSAVLANLVFAFGTSIGLGSDTFIGIENLAGGSGNDQLTGDAGSNVLSGREGFDTLNGGAGDDVYHLDDLTLTDSGYQYDAIVEANGAGHDTAILTALLIPGQAGTPYVYVMPDNLEAAYLNGENGMNVTGNALANDISGSSGDNKLVGLDGDDILSGGSGRDVLVGGAGKDLLFGGTGVDDADYSDRSEAISVTLNGGFNAPVFANGVQEDFVREIENVLGGSGNDSLNGDAEHNSLLGNDGNDTLTSGSAGHADDLEGGAGDDRIVFTHGQGGLAVGGTGTDTLVVNLSDVTGIFIRPVVLDSFEETQVGPAGSLAGGYDGYMDTQGFNNMSFLGIERFEITNTANARDVLLGGDGNDIFDAQAGNDWLRGAGGDDILLGGTGTNTLDGGTGNDLLSFAENRGSATGGSGNDTLVLTVSDGGGIFMRPSVADSASQTPIGLAGSFAAGYSGYLDGTGPGNISFSTIENFQITNLAATGFDILLGGDGNDQLKAGGGDDRLSGGGGNDLLDGGAGIDTLDYSTTTAGVAANLATGAASGAESGSDTLSGFEIVLGGSGNDALTGDASANTLTGADGNDTLNGGDGNDIMTGGLGDDTMDGGLGIDTVDYGAAAAGLNLILSGKHGSATFGSDHDTLLNIENVIGSAAGDALTGSAQANLLLGNGGDDVLDGGGAGNDTLNGGTGLDRANYGAAKSDLTIDLVAGTATGSAIGSDTLISIENVTGGKANDLITGDANANSLIGGTGSDTVHGGAGTDTLSPGDGNDSVFGEDGDDTINAGAGFNAGDRFDGGAGVDTVLLSGDYSLGVVFSAATFASIEKLKLSGPSAYVLKTSDGNLAAGQTLTVDASAATGLVSFDGSSEKDGVLVLTGGTGNDALTGGDQNDSITGGAGDDTLIGGKGNDSLIDKAGNDLFDGGLGIDLADYSADTVGVTVDLSAGTANGTAIGSDTLMNIENVLGGNAGDSLAGDGNANLLSGGAGSDTLLGGAANDTLNGGNALDSLNGGDGDDVLVGGTGNDTLAGGDGSDTADYSAETTVITGNLATGTATGTGSGNDALSTVENISGGSAGDTLTGDANANLLAGNGGNDTLNGGDGDDRLVGGAGNDALIGGNGIDTADYSADSQGFSADLGVGMAAGAGIGSDTLASLENLLGGTGSDTLTGNAGVNVLTGNAGNDTLTGGGAADTLSGGLGNDTFVYGAASDSTSTGYDTISGFTVGQDSIDLSFAVSAVDSQIKHSSVTTATFDTDLAGVVTAGKLGSHHAVVLTVDAGGLAGSTFLIVDANGTAGYQAGQDLVIRMDAPVGIGTLTTASFV